MTLETVTGTLADFGGDLDESIGPRIVFRPNGAAVGAGGIYFSRPIIVDTFGPGGTWTVQLEGTDGLWHVSGSDVWYDVSVDRLVTETDYAPWDHPGWQLKVPSGGGVFSALVVAPTNPAQMWVGPATSPTTNVPEQRLQPSAYTAWYKTNAPEGASNYFEWEAGVWVPKAEISLANDPTMAAEISRAGSLSRSAVETVIAPVASGIIESDPTLAAAAAAKVDQVARPILNEAFGGTRRVRVAMTLPGGTGAPFVPDTRQSVAERLPIFLPADSIRWRIRMRNANFRDTVTYSAVLSMLGFWFGQNTIDAFGQPTGEWAAAPTQVVPAFSHQGSAAYWEGPWIEDPALQIKGRTEHMLGYGYTQPTAANVHKGLGGGWTSNTAADVSAMSISGFTQSAYANLDICLEVEVAATVPIWCAFGDSIVAATGTTFPIRDSAYQKLAIAHGAMPMLFAHHGSTLSMWDQPTQAKWTTWLGNASKPDVVIWQLGCNTVFNGDSLATYQTQWNALLPTVQSKLSKSIVLTTLTARNGSSTDAPREAVRTAVNDWLLGTLPGGAMACFDVAAALEAPGVPGTVLAKYMSADNVHPNSAGQARMMTALRSPGVAPARVHDPRIPLHSLPVPGYTARWVGGRLYGDSGDSLPEWLDVVGGQRAAPLTGWGTPKLSIDQAGRRAISVTGSEGYSLTFARAQPYTEVVVQKLRAVPAGNGIIIGGGVGSARGALFVNNAGKLVVNASSSVVSGASIPVGEHAVLIGVVDGASSVAYVDGAATTGNAGAESATETNIGRYSSAASGPNMEILEYIHYPFALDFTQRASLLTALNAVYGIA